MDAPKYRAFISYSHRDSRWASWLHSSLERYRPPQALVGTVTARGEVPRRLAPIFRDRDELASATDLGTLINAALEGSACQIVLCSPPAAKSKWVNEEILAFKRLGREDRIFCLIVDGEPNASDIPGREDEECFPPALRFVLRVDGTLSDTRSEPVAADARPGKDGKHNAKLKLIAGLLGVGFDALKRREQQRRNRQLAIVAGAATVGMVLTTGLAALAVIERNLARKQTVRAEAEAETARQTTRFLVDLFKISDPSEARGNAVTAREMLDKGAARVDKELAREPAIQATLMDTLGSVYMGLGLYDQARPLLDRAVATRRHLTLEDSLPLSDSLDHLGDLLTRKAQFDAAEKIYREAIQAESSRPTDPASQVQLANSLYGYGVLLRREARIEDAQKNLRDALARQQALYGTVHPDIAHTLTELAQAVADGGDRHAALPLMQSAVAMQRQLRGNDPHPDLAEAINDLALLHEDMGDYEESDKLLRESMDMKRRLYGDRHPEIANALGNLAMVRADKGDMAGAEQLFRQALDMWRSLMGADHYEVANALNNLATVQYDRGATREAIATEREALAVARKAYPHGHPLIATTLNMLGLWLTVAGDYAEANRDIGEGLPMMRRLAGDQHPDFAWSELCLATLQIEQHDYPQALATAREAADIYTSARSATDWLTAAARSAEGAALTGLGRYAEAEKVLTASHETLSKDEGALPVYRILNQRYLDTLHRREKGRRHSTAAGAAAPAE
jgi:tetratricopeptide (TPR) repeat protein